MHHFHYPHMLSMFLNIPFSFVKYKNYNHAYIYIKLHAAAFFTFDLFLLCTSVSFALSESYYLIHVIAVAALSESIQ